MSILFALPCYGGVLSARTASGLFLLSKDLQSNQIEHDILFVTNQSLIPKARSDISNYFLNATKFEYLMWIDADIGFSPKDIFHLLELQVQHATATYRHKVQYPKYSFTLKLDNGSPIWNNSETAVKVLKNVGGFSLIHRSVFETLIEQNLVKKYIPWTDSRPVTQEELDNSFHFYDTPISEENLSILPEDFAFHEKCIAAGMDIWLRPDIKLIHNGNTDFENTDLVSILKGAIN